MVSHDILVRGFGLGGILTQPPVVLGMRDTDFPTRFLGDLGSSQRISTAATVTAGDDGYLHLMQPVQRLLHVAMVDLACNSVGEPRLDPLRIDSAGLVIRRVPRTNDGIDEPQARPDAWVRGGDGKFSWMRLRKHEEDLDPDPSRRPPLGSGQAELDRMLGVHLALSSKTEVSSPAFVAPPQVCDRLEQTIVYAVIPTASGDVSDQPPQLPDYSDGSLKQQLPPLLRAGDHRVPQAGRKVDHRYMSVEYCNANGFADFIPFVNLMQVVAVEFDAFNNTTLGNRLMEKLNSRGVTYGDGTVEKVGEFLRQANRYLVDYDADTNTPSDQLTMPVKWESSSDDDEKAILQAAQNCLQARGKEFLVPAGRYQDHTRLYKLRVFVRVRGHENCPLRTLWSPYSDAFLIAPWYQSSGIMGPPVPLPKPTHAFFKAAKPNVSFVVPDSLMNAMQAASLKKMTDGDGGTPSGVKLTWICGFSIPLITICAFFVLNIFLVLLNIVFWWLPFIKICIPFPVSAGASQGGD